MKFLTLFNSKNVKIGKVVNWKL